MFLKKKTPRLPHPRLARGLFTPSDAGASGDPIALWTDEALFAQTGVRVAFSERQGGTSTGAYSSLNVADHVGDDLYRVQDNRRRLLDAAGASGSALVVPKQVHGDRLLSVEDASVEAVQAVRAEAAKGCDALLVKARAVAALLCFADCVPLVMVAPSGRFAVVHAGWRGVMNGIAEKALRKLVLAEPGLSTDASDVNVYRGAYIHAECFQVGPDVHEAFMKRYGHEVALDDERVDLGRALDAELLHAGVNPERIADVGECTKCGCQRWFSYRAAGGTCGRHGALCVRM